MSGGGRSSSGRGLRGWLKRLLAPSSPGAAPPLTLPPPDGEGPLVWLRIGADYCSGGPQDGVLPASLFQVLEQLRRHGLQIAVSRAGTSLADPGIKGVRAIPDTADSPSGAEALLRGLDPAAILLIGTDVPQLLIEAAHARRIPVTLTEARLNPPRRRFGLTIPPGHPNLTRLARLFMPDSISRDGALELGARPTLVEVTGPLTPIREPQKHNEAEREALADIVQGRQLWLAVCMSEAEEDAVINAHFGVLRYSHRALLIAVPADPNRCEPLAERMKAAGLWVAQRALDEEPSEEINVYLSDDLFELGLWYRLAPLCFMGSTLVGPVNHARDPFEAAALGSAIIHGPQDGQFATEWGQLDGAGAVHRIADPADLGDAVVTLLSPDLAARLATNAWSISTGGAGAAKRIAQAIHDIIRERAA
ncbi:MAG: 3-deoxy-D-manno-octulosonic acid transferase [Paracoccus sp. (in: a-proteobacteria)]